MRPRVVGTEYCPLVAHEPFLYSDLLPTGSDDTPYRLITTEGVSTFEAQLGAERRTFLQVEPEARHRDRGTGRLGRILGTYRFGESGERVGHEGLDQHRDLARRDVIPRGIQIVE